LISHTNKGAKIDKSTFGWTCLARVASLCSRAEFKAGQEQVPILKKETAGDASESAILKCMELTVGKTLDKRRKCPKIAEIPFNSTNKFHVTIHEMNESLVPATNDLSTGKVQSPYLLCMKGAPERILERCSTILMNGAEVPLDDKWRKHFNYAYNELGDFLCLSLFPSVKCRHFDCSFSSVDAISGLKAVLESE
jgi:sodium/potassium-transporting ATPase subunit alpha